MIVRKNIAVIDLFSKLDDIYIDADEKSYRKLERTLRDKFARIFNLHIYF